MLTQSVAKRRFTKTDRNSVRDFVKEELERRRGMQQRKDHEVVWREVDRQIAMKPPNVMKRSGNVDEDWHNAVQLGLLADASEIIAADVIRLMFPGDRHFFYPHIGLPIEVDPETGRPIQPDRAEQKGADGLLRSFMVQQQQDFGFRDRVKMSVKEALSHGSFATEVRWDQMAKFDDGSNVESLSAPVWRPHSMWNTFPDPSEEIVGTELFYKGSMIFTMKMKRSSVLRMKGWMNLDKLDKKGKYSDDIEVVTYHGDLIVARTSGDDMFIPNRKVIIADDEFVFTEIHKTAYPPVIYSGYERDDLRDPYYSSPLIKRSPMSAIATRSANKFLDAVDLKTEPPIVHEKHDSMFMADGGPRIAPGAKIPTAGAGGVKTIDTADPQAALMGLQFAIGEVERGTAVDSVRSGVTPGTEQTATEVVKAEQKGEIRTVDFVSQMERQGLRAFLYMQHDMNRKLLDKSYPFYNDEPHSPDFMWAKKDILPENVSFEIVGSRQLLGEEQRVARFREAAVFTLSSETLSQRVDQDEVLRQVWEDAKVKNPERFLAQNDDDGNAELEQLRQEAEAQIQELQAQMQELSVKAMESHVKELEARGEAAERELQVTKEQVRNEALQEQLKIERARDNAEASMRQTANQVEQMTKKVRDVEVNGKTAQIEGTIKEVANSLTKAEQERARMKSIVLKELRARGEADLAEKVDV